MRVNELKAGDRIRVMGDGTRGWDVAGEGYLVAESKQVETLRNLNRIDPVRLRMNQDPAATPTRQNFVPVLPGTETGELNA
ncbi:hypothetical protein ABZ714_13090 [Streptomyces sp. NPDC006798]|uniref:hypothetical protein n=1 Tax=Streptomyces sp. NPDC006798 TaxID=3155462 RepID=UPI0033D9092D